MKKIILVTGGNRGIGREICRELSEKGHQVILGSRTEQKAKDASIELGNDIFPVELDVSSNRSIKSAAESLKKEFGRIDVLINNAGIWIGSEGLTDPNIDNIREIFETNFFGPISMNGFFLPLLKKSDEGRIINISSGMGALDDLKGGGYAGYRLSKTGLNAQTILLANELQGSKIKVNSMCPGWVRTGMGGGSAPRDVSKGAETAVWLSLEKDIPSGKFFRDKKIIPW